MGLWLRVRSRLGGAFGRLAYEWRFKLDTTGIVSLPSHDTRNLPYQGASWRLLRQCLPKRDLEPQDVFLDAGCGKGRIVIQAARLYEFRRVVGFDLAPELVAAAKTNVSKLRGHLKCEEIYLLAADAETWDVPDDVTIVFMYNPFTGDVLKHFVASILRSYDRAPRRLRVLYVEGWGWEPEAVEETGRFKLVTEMAGGAWGPALRAYELAPPGPGG